MLKTVRHFCKKVLCCAKGVGVRYFNPPVWQDNFTECLLELTNCCNLQCIMCPNPGHKRKRGFMEESTFLKILQRCKESDMHKLCLHATGEPLLHPDFKKYINMIDKEYFTSVRFSTNGMLLDQDMIDNIMASPVTRINISFSGWDKESYESIYRGGDFEVVSNNIRDLKKTMQQNPGTSKKIFVYGVVKRGDKEKAINFLLDCGLDKDEFHIGHGHAFAGKYTEVVDDRILNDKSWVLPPFLSEPYYCYILDMRVGVFHDGKVTACPCHDLEGELLIGNIFENSFTEIRNGEKYQAILNAFKRGRIENIPICRECADISRKLKQYE